MAQKALNVPARRFTPRAADTALLRAAHRSVTRAGAGDAVEEFRSTIAAKRRAVLTQRDKRRHFEVWMQQSIVEIQSKLKYV